MGFFDGLMGNASEIKNEDAQKEFGNLLIREERIEKSYKLIRDLFLFTNKRLLLVDKQGMSGKKVEYHSIPYSSITHFAVETAGTFDLDAELKIWISGMDLPLTKTFNKSLNIYDVHAVLAGYILESK
ncbi:PH domain-containing protein [Jeotgalibacillus sp. ET6]|uniref:PH domain-containing protein n=1 Tax=Jeotgalibacillus sp. ET6 TaxID=3037260 RepID=UPI002418AC1D|nr:PH domain-containing protein [Jeotgalibacillus sp. ET6]MDG5472670.1 PH domain-containing protein [Jeotgalibacillus sp. ET6]